MCWKRLRISENVGAEFIAGGRIWWLRIRMVPEAVADKRWLVNLGISSSCGVHPEAVRLIDAQRGKPGCATRPRALRKEFRSRGVDFSVEAKTY
ncbi:hypothetical protein AZE42_06671 [Rhizopogon vesiculosus]|uniref:Uncharacterized protein n=1 Tax=Rhizopogon vesiculosus TaxID=180088 RepID=A0A1J8Q7E5_9AGAM|nr:hypothetical protein AZE42_06671 [Rhizopogon vesiculosus]